MFAQTLSTSLGRPVSVAEATEIMNNPDMMSAISRTVGANATTTDTSKDVDQAMRSWADANPQATPAEIAQHRSDLLEQKVGGLSSIGKSLAEDRRNWMNAHKGATFQDMIKDRPDLADEVTYGAGKAEAAKGAVDEQKNLVADRANFSTAAQNYDKALGLIDQLKSPRMQAGLKQFLGTTGQYNPVANMDDDGKAAWALYKQLMALQYVAGTQDFKGAGRITQSELQQDAPSQSTMGQLNQSQDDFNKGMNDYRKQIAQHRANLFGKAQMLDDPALSDEDYATYVNQIYKPGGSLGPKGDIARKIPDFSKMSEADADAAFNALPSGKVFIGPDGKPHKKN